jgi:CDP-diacylglycerol--serine O-phosphatidyltransferase
MKRKKRFKKEQLRRGIYILPNMFTSLNFFCGFYSIVASINGNFGAAAVAILIAVVFDGMDGKIARATNATSKFGLEYDSLADLASFGLAPGLMIYLWALKPFGKIGWLAAFLFAICGALRLARFNTQAGTTSSEYFTGLPIPAGAGLVSVTVLFYNRFQITASTYPVLLLIMLYTLAFLMVSTFKYYSFKKTDLFREKNFNVLVAAVLILILIAYEPAIVLFVLGFSYVMSGIYLTVKHSLKHKVAEPSEADEQEPGSI